MKILCFGDSNTFGFDPRGFFGGRYDRPWPDILAEKLDCTVLNWGENGRKIPAKAVDFPGAVDVLIVMLGTNDLLQGASPKTACIRMERFLETMDREKLLLIAPPPMKPEACVSDEQLFESGQILAFCYRDLANRMGVRFIDAGQWNVPLAYDGVHFTEGGHRAFAEGLITYFTKGD